MDSSKPREGKKHNKTSAQPSVMLQEYLSAEPTVSERIAQGGKYDVLQGEKIKKNVTKTIQKATKELDNKSKKSARG